MLYVALGGGLALAYGTEGLVIGTVARHALESALGDPDRDVSDGARRGLASLMLLESEGGTGLVPRESEGGSPATQASLSPLIAALS